MSRRLGDDPLSRQRKSESKNRRAGEVDNPSSGMPAAASNYPLSTQAQLGPESITKVSSSTPASLSYNDVFFQRRSEDKDEEVDRKSEHVAAAQIIPNPAVPPAVSAEPTPSYQAPPPRVTSSAPMPALDATTGSLPSQSGKAVGLVNPSPPLAEIDQEQRAEAQESQPRTQEGGFLKRMLGRLRK